MLVNRNLGTQAVAATVIEVASVIDGRGSHTLAVGL